MTLQELLDELQNNILYDRSNLVEGDSDALWSRDTLIRYINEAYFRFARNALCIQDGKTPQITTFKTAAGVQNYTLDKSVLAVKSMRVSGDTCDLARAGHANFGSYHTPDTYFFDPSQLSNLPPGRPKAFGTDECLSETADGSVSAINVFLYPQISTEYAGLTINMRVIRMPLSKLQDLRDVPELPETHHMEMLDWAAYLALRIVDHDAGDSQRAKEFRASFEAATQEARKLALRKMFTPLQHGFGRNGWSWEGNGGYP